MELEDDIFVLNILCKFHKVVIKTTQLKDQTLSKFGVISGTKSNNPCRHMAIYGPLSNLRKPFWYQTLIVTMCHKTLIKITRLRERTSLA